LFVGFSPDISYFEAFTGKVFEWPHFKMNKKIGLFIHLSV